MPHSIIFIYDENGNVIGEYRPPHDEGGDLTEEPAITLNLQKIAELLGLKKDKG